MSLIYWFGFGVLACCEAKKFCSTCWIFTWGFGAAGVRVMSWMGLWICENWSSIIGIWSSGPLWGVHPVLREKLQDSTPLRRVRQGMRLRQYPLWEIEPSGPVWTSKEWHLDRRANHQQHPEMKSRFCSLHNLVQQNMPVAMYSHMSPEELPKVRF